MKYDYDGQDNGYRYGRVMNKMSVGMDINGYDYDEFYRISMQIDNMHIQSKLVLNNFQII